MSPGRHDHCALQRRLGCREEAYKADGRKLRTLRGTIRFAVQRAVCRSDGDQA